MNVLIVEDEMHTSKLLKEIIEQDEDFLVTGQLETLSEAIAYLSKHQSKLDLLFWISNSQTDIALKFSNTLMLPYR